MACLLHTCTTGSDTLKVSMYLKSLPLLGKGMANKENGVLDVGV